MEMLVRLRPKLPQVPLAALDALALPFRDGAFDAVTVGFGVRNWVDRARGFAEVRRVLRSGGRFAILEFCPAPETMFGRAYRVYSRRVLPRIASLFSGDRSAYRYLPESVDLFPAPDALAAELAAAGFVRARIVQMAFGTVALHVAERGG